ncbi:hypothetical protein TL16_g09838 [Triparma laevis f. inornata]|uniref:CN hydrolase domain-containing protein n=1 Tax=Triparma laevis f. inornata TaxID=1714386 RepID=A0A9W7BAJ6_9STRA|nr:hypothetical protein TL16_g09838 [Triparma laevis f. inornata]
MNMQGMSDAERNAAARARWSTNNEDVVDRFADHFKSSSTIQPPSSSSSSALPPTPTQPPPPAPTSTSTTKIAVAQLNSTFSKATNLVTIFKLAASAAAANCSMLFLPEIATLLPPKGTTIENAEPIPSSSALPFSPPFQSSTLQTLSEIAKRNNLTISVGSIHESGASAEDGSPRVYNTSLLLDSSGTLIGKYRKIHLFSIDTATTKLSETGE